MKSVQLLRNQVQIGQLSGPGPSRHYPPLPPQRAGHTLDDCYSDSVFWIVQIGFRESLTTPDVSPVVARRTVTAGPRSLESSRQLSFNRLLPRLTGLQKFGRSSSRYQTLSRSLAAFEDPSEDDSMVEGVAGSGEARGTGGGCRGAPGGSNLTPGSKPRPHSPLTQPIPPGGPHGFPSLFCQTGTFYSCFVTFWWAAVKISMALKILHISL